MHLSIFDLLKKISDYEFIVLKTIQKWIKPLASLRLAVFVLLAMGVISAVGTFYESLYNAEYAKLVVYQSKWMVGIQVLLAINLTAVMVDRLPWKERHIPFLLAHVGILMVLAGSVQTYLYGVDGVMVFPLGGQNRFVQVSDKELSLYSSLDGAKFETLFSKPVNFFRNTPEDDKPILFNEGLYSQIKVKNYYQFAEAKNNILESENESDGPALRFFIEGARAKETGWLIANKIFKEDARKLGAAELVLLLEAPEEPLEGQNKIYFYPNKEDDQKVDYALFNSVGESKGSLTVGQTIQTGWMDFNLRLLSYKRHAYKGVQFNEIDMPHALSTEAVLVEFMGQDYWLGLGQPVKIFKEDRVFILTYGKKRVDIGFNLSLKNFKVGRYQGTLRAASYESLVEVDGEEHLISMNEPLKRNGLTFYQSSFQEDELGNPTHSILSVNRDPGRFLKYLGCLVIALGTLALFYMRKKGHKWRFFK